MAGNSLAWGVVTGEFIHSLFLEYLLCAYSCVWTMRGSAGNRMDTAPILQSYKAPITEGLEVQGSHPITSPALESRLGDCDSSS